jgi:hypothetical protein
MNASLFSANRNTHLKIVAVALAAAIAVTGIAIRLNIVSTKLGSEVPTASEPAIDQLG